MADRALISSSLAVVQMANKIARKFKMTFFQCRLMNLLFIFQKEGEAFIGEGCYSSKEYGTLLHKLKYFTVVIFYHF